MSKREKKLQEWWGRITSDPTKALEDFVKEVEESGDYEAAKQGRSILSGDKTYWQKGATSIEEAANFLITNSLMKASGMGVIK